LKSFNYSGVLEKNPQLLKGHTLDLGKYPNEVQQYKPFLGRLKKIFKLKRQFQLKAEKRLQMVAKKYKKWKKLGEYFILISLLTLLRNNLCKLIHLSFETKI